jgi:hypothetical protein
MPLTDGPAGAVRAVFPSSMQLEMAPTAQGDQIRLIIAAAFGTGHDVMVLQVILRPAGYAELQSHDSSPC